MASTTTTSGKKPRTRRAKATSANLGLEFRPAESRPLDEYVEGAYLNYSMYVILDRALPQLADGLKPVQRRIIYAMSELGLRSGAKYKKSARTIGDVIGKFHPHGDSACYEAMVLMAQDFTTRYCLVDGQGNWGSVDNAKSFAAMRYTEARLTPYAQLLLSELSRATADWQPNFDGTLEEPTSFPVRVPNVILNGATGIAVGMTTEIPSHNLSEIMDACLLLLAEPKLSKHLEGDDALPAAESAAAMKKNRPVVERLMEKVPAPDFASGGVLISSPEEIAEIYTRGTGGLKVRCRYDISGKDIIISELPPHTSTYKVIEQVQQQIQNKKLPMLAGIRDESDDQNPVLLALETRKGTDRARVMSHLFATTDLEKNVRVNLNAISTDGRPRVWALNELLHHWLDYRRACLIKKLEYDLAKVNRRLHILEGLMIVFLNLDEVIRIIREEEKPKPKLMKKFKLSDEQAEAILETKLRHLAKLEEQKIQGEEEDLTDKKYFLEKHLKSKDAVTKLLQEEFAEIKKEYGDKRRTALQPGSAQVVAEAIKQEQLVSKEAVTLVLSVNGWVRLAKGHELAAGELSYRDGDRLLCSWQGQNNQVAVFMDNHGRAYSVMAHTLPSARGLGEALSGRLDLSDGARIDAGLLARDGEELLLLSKDGYGFIVKEDELLAVNRKKGKQIMRIKNNVGMVQPAVVPGGAVGSDSDSAPAGAFGSDSADSPPADATTESAAASKSAAAADSPPAATATESAAASKSAASSGGAPDYSIAVLTVKERLLVIEPDEIPRMDKGKGIKLINTAYPKDEVKQCVILAPQQELAVSYSSTEAPLVLTEKDLKKYRAKRATKGKNLKIPGAKIPLTIGVHQPPAESSPAESSSDSASD